MPKALALNFRSNVEIAHVFDPSVVTSYMEAILGLPVKERQHISNESLERLQKDFTAAGIEAHTSLPEGHRPHAALLQAGARTRHRPDRRGHPLALGTGTAGGRLDGGRTDSQRAFARC